MHPLCSLWRPNHGGSTFMGVRVTRQSKGVGGVTATQPIIFPIYLDKKMSSFILQPNLTTCVQNLLLKMPKKVNFDVFFCKCSLFWHDVTYDVTAMTYMECWHFIWYGWIEEAPTHALVQFYECGVLNNEFSAWGS